ncbi:MAG TPA: hypothetical protein VFG96_06530 [Jiangellaceae bacterium]|jgi:uncharacterized membrane protein YkoI|nr:hypothetical protein [Jiangellaceae bacterium]
MARMTKLAVAAVSGVAAAAASVGIAVANSGDDDETEQPISGDALQKASDAALEHTGGGSVTGTEVGDEESLYEVEVTLDNGRQVDVQLDESFAVVGTEGDDDNTEDQD